MISMHPSSSRSRNETAAMDAQAKADALIKVDAQARTDALTEADDQAKTYLAVPALPALMPVQQNRKRMIRLSRKEL